MRGFLYAGAALAVAGTMTAFGVAAQSTPVISITKAAHVGNATVNNCKTDGVLKSDQGMLNTSSYFVECKNRTAAQLPYAPETHAKDQDEVFYVIAGAATLVTDGKVVGKEVEGGTTTHLTAGDVMVVPGGVPHWFKEVPTQITYLLVRRKAQ